jgi:AraC family transcriptional activator of pobA
MKTIPVHQLKSRASSGLEMRSFAGDTKPADVETLGAHRDDHYLFFLLGSGNASLMIDFNELHFKDLCLYYILPGQVHHRIRSDMETGWYMAVDTSLVPPDYRDVFEGKLLVQQPATLNKPEFDECNLLINLLNDKYIESKNDAFHLPVTYALLEAFIGIVASYYRDKEDNKMKVSRPVELARQFKRLLNEHVLNQKTPSGYADLMNVSEGYLNEVLKKVTGFSVSQLILNEVILEAKRLLYYSKLNVKEIAHSLGYQDHTYFSRIFKNSEGISPLQFRSKYLK